MKKSILYLFIFLIFIGLVGSYSGIVLADNNGDGSSSGSGNSGSDSRGDQGRDRRSSGSSSDSSDNDNSGSSNEGSDVADGERSNRGSGSDDDISETKETIIDDDGREVEVRKKTREKDDEMRTEEKRTFFDENGNEVVIFKETRVKDGETRTVVKRKITDSNGVEITFRTKTIIEEEREKVINTIEVKGAEITTKLSVREESREGIPRIKAKLSTGDEQEIIVLPDEALQIAFEEIQASDNFIFEITEVVDGDTLKAVFFAKATKSGKLLGIFNTQIDLETLIDTETGEVIKTNRPWWAFLVNGADESSVCHISEEDLNKRRTLNVAIPSIKGHLEHGDSLGICIAECGDGIIIEGQEMCETDNVQKCTTADGYAGSETCNLTCDGFDSCISGEFCGDGIINGNEVCDDSNNIEGDRCDSLCQIEIVEEPVIDPLTP